MPQHLRCTWITTRSSLCVAIVVVTIGRALQAQSVMTTPPVPRALLHPATLYDIRAEVAPLDESSQLPERTLKDNALPPGSREIRIYSGLVIGYPHTALILREERGRVSGRMLRYWPVNDSSVGNRSKDDVDIEAKYAALDAGRCDRVTRNESSVTCTIRFSREPDWRGLLALVDSLHGWDLPDESQVPHRGYVVDGWRVRVEARRDTSYHRYQYHNPQIYRPPEGSNALALMTLADSLFQFTMPPKQLQFARGIYLYGPDTSDFWPCDRPNEGGKAEGNLGPIRALVGDSAWRARRAPTQAFEVSAWLRRVPADADDRAQRKSEFTWGVDSVTSVVRAVERRCHQQ